MKNELKLYVWEDVLEDYRAGIMFALAENAEKAREEILKKMDYEHTDLRIEPREVTKSEGFYIYGSSWVVANGQMQGVVRYELRIAWSYVFV